MNASSGLLRLSSSLRTHPTRMCRAPVPPCLLYCRGNKLRFANHSLDANCKAQILLVDGEHRVAVFAAKDIAPGDELLYNYRCAGRQCMRRGMHESKSVPAAL